MSTVPEENQVEEAEDPQAEFCSACILKVEKMYNDKTKAFTLKTSEEILLGGIGAVTAGGLLFCGVPGAVSGGNAAKTATEKLTKLGKRSKGFKVVKMTRQKLDPESSADFERKFRLKVLEAAVVFYNVYEFQLQHIYMRNADETLSKVPALRKVGKAIGEKIVTELKDVLKGKEKTTEFDETAFQRNWSKLTDRIKDERLFFKVDSKQPENLSVYQIFNKSLPLFYEEGNNRVWMRKADKEMFDNELDKETKYLRRPKGFEWDEFLKNLDLDIFTQIELTNLDISNYKWKHPTSESIDKLLNILEPRYFGPDRKLKFESTQTNDKVCKIENMVQETNETVKKLVKNNSEGSEVIKKFNNVDKSSCSSLSEPEIAESLQKAIEKVDMNKSPKQIEDKMVLIHGMGGLGKTSLAMWCANELYADKNVWWINAETPTSIGDSFDDLAKSLKIDDSKIQRATANGERLAHFVINHFSTQKITDVLLIYDNANQMTTCENDGAFGISEYLPKISTSKSDKWAPVILVTSQWAGWKIHKDQTFPLDSWSETMTIHFLKTRFNSISNMSGLCNFEDFPGSDLESSMKGLHKCLGGFPLATAIVASNIVVQVEVLVKKPAKKENDLSIDECRKKLLSRIEIWLDEDFKELKQHSFASGDSRGYKHTLKTVWDSTMKLLRQRETRNFKLAIRLLNMMAFIPTDDITLSRLYFTLHPHYPLTKEVKAGFNQSTAYQDISLALNVLEKYSLTRVDWGQDHVCEEDDTINVFAYFKNKGQSKVQIHRLLQKKTIDGLEEETPKMDEILEPLAKFTATYETRDWSKMEKLAEYLDQFKWPGESYKHYLDFTATKLNYSFQMRKIIYSKLKIYLNSLETILVEEERRDVEYSDLCKLAFILIPCDLKPISGLTSGKSIEASSEMDKEHEDNPHVVKYSRILNEVLTHLEKYEGKHSFFYFGLCCLKMFDPRAFTGGAEQKTLAWLNTHFKRISADPSSLPPHPHFYSLLELAMKVGVSTEDRIRFATLVVKAVKGLDAEYVAKFQCRMTLLEIWGDCGNMVKSVMDSLASYSDDWPVRDDKMEVNEAIFKLFFETAATLDQRYRDFLNSVNLKVAEVYTYSSMDYILDVLLKLALDKDSAASAMNSPEFKEGFCDFLNFCDFKAFSIDIKCIYRRGSTRHNVYFKGLLLGLILFSHDHLHEGSNVQDAFQNFLEVAGQKLKAFRLGAKANNYNQKVFQKFVQDNIRDKDAQALENFLEIHKENEAATEAVELANFFKELAKWTKGGKTTPWDFFDNLPRRY